MHHRWGLPYTFAHAKFLQAGAQLVQTTLLRLVHRRVDVLSVQYLNGHYNFVARPTLSWCDVERAVERLNFKSTILLLYQCDPFSDSA